MISPQAVVHTQSQIGDNVTIAPFAIVEKDVVLDDHVELCAHAVVKSGTRIGSGTKVYEGAIVGGDPQDLKYKGESSYLHIGKGVQIREYCTINRGTMASGSTDVGDDTLLMAYAHVAHDCKIGSGVIIANSVQIAGHVEIDDHATIGGMSAIQQFMKIGKHSYIGGGTLIRKDVPPFIKAAHDPLRYMGVNKIGLQRKGVSSDIIQQLESICRTLFVRHDNVSLALKELDDKADSTECAELVQFILNSTNGIIKGYSSK